MVEHQTNTRRTGFHPTPLSPMERDTCRALGIRLQEDLRALIDLLPEHKQTSYGLSRAIGVDRSICQRVIAAVRSVGPSAGLDVLDRLPGVEGLIKFVEGAGRALGDAREVRGAAAAVEQLSRAIDDLSGSHARLRTRLRTPPSNGSDFDDPDWEIRRRAYIALSALTRSCCDAEVILCMTRPCPDDEGSIEHASAKALVGYRSQPGATAEVVTFYHSGEKDGSEHEDLQIAPLETDRAGLLVGESAVTELCTKPLPVVTSRGPKGMAVDVIDPTVTNQPIDFVVARRTSPVSHPRLHQDKVLSHGARIKTPTRRLVFDSFVHRSIASASIPAIAVSHWHPTLLTEPRKCWYERLPGSPRIGLLGAASKAHGSSAWAKHARLIELMFGRLGWPPEEFLTFRVDIEFPIWGAVYVQYFDFEI